MVAPELLLGKSLHVWNWKSVTDIHLKLPRGCCKVIAQDKISTPTRVWKLLIDITPMMSLLYDVYLVTEHSREGLLRITSY